MTFITILPKYICDHYNSAKVYKYVMWSGKILETDFGDPVPSIGGVSS